MENKDLEGIPEASQAPAPYAIAEANHEDPAATSAEQASPCSSKATRATRQLVGEPLFDPVEWGARLKDKIINDGWSYRKAAKEIGITSASLHRAAKGKTPDVETFLRCELWMAPTGSGEVAQLATLLSELDALADSPNTPPGIRNFVGHRIDALRIALSSLGISRPADPLPAKGWSDGNG